MKKKILLLGGTGAMGKYLVDILDKSNEWDVLVSSRKVRKNYNNIKYIVGNALDNNFVRDLCNNKYDVIVDFMNYNVEQFENNAPFLLNSCNHYLFLSSCRVFNNSDIIDENTDRLLDTIDDPAFLETQRYALRKARQENILHKSNKKNWTIIRPYITYGDERLQLGIYEKEEWLYRILNNKPLIVNSDVLERNTTLTYGKDVSNCIYDIINNDSLYGEEINIVSDNCIKWKDILDIYLQIIKEYTNIEPQIYYSNQLSEIEVLFEGGYNTKYDRLWDRKFNNEKLKKYCRTQEFVRAEAGLKTCLINFLKQWNDRGNDAFGIINEEYEKQMDLLVNSFQQTLSKEKKNNG